jgi:serine/threonine-protein kinase
MSPEAAMHGVSAPAGDIYSLGVILGELVVGKPLWEGDNLPQLLGQKMELTSTIVRIPVPLRTTLKAMLDPEPERRPTAAQARAMLVDIEAANAADTVFEAPPAGKATLDMRGSKVTVKEASDPFAATRVLEKTPAATSSLSMAEEPPSKHARGVALAVIIGAAATVAIAAVIFVRMGSSPSTQSTAPRDAAVAMTTPIDAAAIEVDAAPAVVTTKVRVETKPSGATVLVDGVAKKTPFELELSAPVSLTATYRGYLPASFTVDPDKPLAPVVLKKKPMPKQPDDSKSPF